MPVRPVQKGIETTRDAAVFSVGFRPRLPVLALLGLWAGIGAAAGWWSVAVALWEPAGVLIGAGLVADLWWLGRLPLPRLHRRIRHTLPQGVWSRVELVMENPDSRRKQVTVHDLHPPGFDVRRLPQQVRLAAWQRARVDYELRPPQRGDFTFSGCDLRLTSPLGLWSRRCTVPLPVEIRVFPNFAEISHYTLLATSDRLSQIGVRTHRRRGTGAEFHQLREYRAGDSLRQIDWKATAKVRKLISKEYQDERDQRVLFLLDCGRHMRHADRGRGHLDEALNALLLLAYVAVRQGDAVGLMTYGGPKRWFAPRKGADTVNRLLGAVYDLQPALEAADPLAAARELMQALSRRALVVILTNSRDEAAYEVETAARLLRNRHLVLIADLRESSLDVALEAAVHDRETALRFHAIHDYLETRRRHHERLHHYGAYVLDLLPHQLPVALVNRYLDIKRAGVL